MWPNPALSVTMRDKKEKPLGWLSEPHQRDGSSHPRPRLSLAGPLADTAAAGRLCLPHVDFEGHGPTVMKCIYVYFEKV